MCYTVTGDGRFHAILGGGPSYIVHPSDTAPALVALDAQIKIAGPSGERVMPLEKFFVLPSVDFKRENILKPSEIINEIVVPYPKSGSKGYYYKVRERLAWDHAIVSVATVVQSMAESRGTYVWFSAAWHRFRGARRKLNSSCMARKSMRRLL